MRALVDYCLAQFPGPLPPEDAPGRDDPAVVLMHQVVERLADLAASYMVAGFVHGVLNSDNMNVTGESFDYGPWRWLPLWDPNFTAAYFDQTGLYAFGRQPEAIRWNLAQLAIALCSDGAKDVSGQIFAVRGNEVFLFNQPRPIRGMARLEGWTPQSIIDHALPAMKANFTDPGASASVFPWDPV